MDSIIFEHQYTVGGYVTFRIKVTCGEFSGASNFCISESLLKEAISTLSELYNNLKGSYQMNDYDSNDFILFEFLERGKMKITGQVGGSFREQYLNYQFITDQTLLGEIISSLKRLLSSTRGVKEWLKEQNS